MNVHRLFVVALIGVVVASSQPSGLVAHTAPKTEHVKAAGSPRQLRVFQKLWKIVNDTYIYPDFRGVNWAAKKTEFENAIAQGISDDEFYYRLRKLIGELKDDHSVYLPPYVAEEIFELFFNSGEYEGVGLITSPVPERQYVVVLQVVPGSPADKAGIRPHDKILFVGGYPAIDREGYSQSFLLSGPAGSPVPVTVLSAEGVQRSLDLVRATLPAVDLIDQKLLPNAANKKIGYLNIPTFFSDTIDKQARATLKELMAQAGGKMDGLVIDMRINSGGSVVALTNILGLFTKGNLGKFRNRKGPGGSMNAKGENIGNSQSVPIIVLTGPDTASAAEIFAGVLQFKGRARVAGAPSAGNIEGLKTYIFEDGSILFIAEQQFSLPNGYNWEGVGIQPIANAPSKWDEISVDNDPAILAAVDLLSK